MADLAETHGLRFAGKEGKTTLYKFKPFSDATEKTRVREILVEHRIYFSRPSQLNDPFDLAPRLDVNPDREILLRDAERYRVKRRPPYTNEEEARFREWLQTADLTEIAGIFRARAYESLENYWVFSLAGNRDHPMLWSHYAGGHTGVCIHFLANSASPFSGALGVVYAGDRPVLPVPITLPEYETTERVSLRKGEFWDYEDEYRLVRYPTMDFFGTDLQFEGQHARFAARCITGITVGARMPQEEIETICAIAVQHEPVLPVWKAHARESYELDFVRLSP